MNITTPKRKTNTISRGVRKGLSRMFYRADLLRAAASAQDPPLNNTAIAEGTGLARHTVGRVMKGDANVNFMTLHTVARFLGFEDMGPLMVADRPPQILPSALEAQLPKERIA